MRYWWGGPVRLADPRPDPTWLSRYGLGELPGRRHPGVGKLLVFGLLVGGVWWLFIRRRS